jgi:hypothetical protein
VIRPLDYTYVVLPELLEYAPFFDGYIGAMDNTHIDVIVDEEVRDDHINRHGDTTQNVLAMCDFNMWFVYIATGTEGSAHDMRVKKKAELDPYFPPPTTRLVYHNWHGCCGECEGCLVLHTM